ncbi:MAG TPA: hypothetical protein VGO58_02835 [Chitinophagaceae bacterium]|jgi:hypothetical protein|nr:hypothetical protein [Chitinophagaceae bacterium]
MGRKNFKLIHYLEKLSNGEEFCGYLLSHDITIVLLIPVKSRKADEY